MKQREVKFRALYKGQWVYSDSYNSSQILGAKLGESICGVFWSTVGMTETRSQFIGLKDKNGVDIYEGDIFEYKKELWQIVYSLRSAMFWFMPTDQKGRKCLINCTYTDRGQVIGNIYENKKV